MVIAKEGIVGYDFETGTSRPIAGVPACDKLLVSANGSTLVTVKQVSDGDVWLGEFR